MDVMELRERVEIHSAQMIQRRRDLHARPELAWREFQTAALVADILEELGYEVHTGQEVTPEEYRMGVPGTEELESAWQEAERDLSEERTLREEMRGGYTGVIGILDSGIPGPVMALRVDMDALPVTEEDRGHEYISLRPGRMHACGHDGHTAMGLAVAEIMAELRGRWKGVLKLFFQPAEEGVRGGMAMSRSGFLEDVDAILGCHIFGRAGRREPMADVVPGARGSLATTKLDVEFIGQSAHAGSFPELGRHAMLAMAAAIQNLYSIPRHSGGSSRINVGRAEAGSGRNVIADRAFLELEVRGGSSEVNQYMEEYAKRVIRAAADMHQCRCEIRTVGSARSIESTDILSSQVQNACRQTGLIPTTFLHEHSEGSEDCSYLMDYVKERGGEAAFMILLTDTTGPGHSPQFDFDETVLVKGVLGICTSLLEILGI